MDFIILTLPIRPLWKIQASAARRLGIIATITVGGIAVIVSCLRIIILHRFAVDPDFTYILGQMVIISAIELNVAIIAASVPSLKAVWRKHISKTLTDQTTSVQLSARGKQGHSSSDAGPTIIYQRGEPDLDQADLTDSSSTNHLVAEQGSFDWVDITSRKEPLASRHSLERP